jgi:hypothetical protein
MEIEVEEDSREVQEHCAKQAKTQNQVDEVEEGSL